MNIDLRAKPFCLTDAQIKWVEDTKAQMSTVDKLHHLFCLVAYDADEEYCRYISETVRPGAFMGRAMKAETCAKAIRLMQQYSTIPLLVAANFESGGNGLIKEGTSFGSQMQVAATGDKSFADDLGEVCGREGAAFGANWSFAPLVDIDTNFRNPVTNTRTFGSNPETVREMATAYVQAIQRNGVAACIKHFPGDGCDERDQHVAISINSRSVEEWDATYGKVYSACIEAGAMSVMVGHILQPAYTRYFAPETKDEEQLPASVNPALLQGLLRQKLKFNGLVITDSSTMAGLALFMPREQAVPATIAAGCDMFLFTNNLEEDIAYMEQGYRDGIITDERLDEAITRILALKAALHLPEKQANGTLCPDLTEAVSKLKNPELCRRSELCADRAITLVKEEQGILPITPARYKRILFCPLSPLGVDKQPYDKPGSTQCVFLEGLREAGFEVTVFSSDGATEGKMESVQTIIQNYDLILYSATRRVGYQAVNRLEWATPRGADLPILCHSVPTVFVSFGNPYYLLDVPHMRTFINAYAGSRAAIKAVIRKLTGGSEFVGISPVDAFCGKWEARLSFGPALTPPPQIQKENTNMNTQNIKGLLFDLDGVLLSTDKFHYLAWKSLADELNIPFSEKDNEKLRGVSRMESLEIVLSARPELQFNDEQKAEFATRKNDRYRNYLEQLTPADVSDEVRDTLAELRRRGYRLAVGSSSKNARFILEKVQLTDAFDAIADGTNIQKSKPDPEVFLTAARFVDTPAADCAVIEDAEAGIAAAVSGGMLPVGIAGAASDPNTAIALSAFGDLLSYFK